MVTRLWYLRCVLVALAMLALLVALMALCPTRDASAQASTATPTYTPMPTRTPTPIVSMPVTVDGPTTHLDAPLLAHITVSLLVAGIVGLWTSRPEPVVLWAVLVMRYGGEGADWANMATIITGTLLGLASIGKIRDRR